MKKSDFIRNVVEVAKEREIEVSQVVVRELMDVMETVIADVIMSEDSVNVMGIKFESVNRDASEGKSPKTGEPWAKPAHKAGKVSFLYSKKKELEREI